MNVITHTQTPHQTNTQDVATNTPVMEAPEAQMGARHCRHCRNVEMFKRGTVNGWTVGAVSAVTGMMASAVYSSFTAQDEGDFQRKFVAGASTSIAAAFFGMTAHLIYLTAKYVGPEHVLISNAPDTEPSESTIKDKND